MLMDKPINSKHTILTAKDINDALNIWFNRYDYRLNNCFVFDWESDFLCQSSGGYWVECEVKISRHDFFRDFDKDKHKLFKAVLAGRTHRVIPWGKGDGDLICSYETPVMRWDYDGRDMRGWPNWAHVRQRGVGKWAWEYIVNDYGRCFVHRERVDVYAPATRIHFEKIADRPCPHQFYYVVPDGLVELDEIPHYAGLIEIVDGAVAIVRRAPYMHKRKMDLTRQLLRKYYNLWRFNYPGDKYDACVNAKLWDVM